jgi:hypothetical protein
VSTTALANVAARPLRDRLPRTYLVVLDAGQFSLRCRRCSWISLVSRTLTEARRLGEKHVCPSNPGRRRLEPRLRR